MTREESQEGVGTAAAVDVVEAARRVRRRERERDFGGMLYSIVYFCMVLEYICEKRRCSTQDWIYRICLYSATDV